MSSNRVVTYIDIGLSSVAEYWQENIMPTVQEFRKIPSARSVFHAAHSVWHLHDWVWHERNPGLDTRGAAFNTYRSNLLVACPDLGWLRDVADAGKHRGLGRLPEVAGAHPQRKRRPGVTTRLLAGPLEPGGGSRLVYVLVLNDGSKQDVDAVLRAATEYWQNELKTLALPSPFA